MITANDMLETQPFLAASPLGAVYVVSLIVGGGLLLVSALFGHHSNGSFDVDASAGAGFDVDASADVGHVSADHGHNVGGVGGLAGWFSVQFVIFFLAMFGLIGTTLTWMTTISDTATFIAAFLGGLLIGQVAHQVLRALKRSGSTGEVVARDFLNCSARVSVAIEPSRRGEVSVQVRGGERFVCASSKRPGDRFATGDQVVIVNFHQGVAEVVSQQEHEFVSGSQPGART